MNLDLATKIAENLVRIESDLNNALHLIETNCKQDEFQLYRTAFGKLMGTIYLDILEPLFDEHPSLIPPDWSWLKKK
jgi:hypothetical protein